VYEAFFGLSDAPFRLTPDPRYLYLSPKHAEALAHLRAGLVEPGGFVCITGDIGAGKTTLLRAFLDGLGPEVSTAYVFNPTLSAEDLLQRITRDLGVPAAVGRPVDVMDALNAHLLAQRAAGRLSVVVIDEAQAVSIDVLEELRLLSNLETSTEKLLRLVLVGQPQLATLLVDPSLKQLNQRITLRWHLGPLTYSETVGYVRHRLAVASGQHKTDLFTTAAFVLLQRFSGGVPRLVNMIAHRAMLVTYVRRKRRVTARAILRAYGEIRAVPLRSASRARRAGWAVATAAVALAIMTVGVPRLRLDAMLPAEMPVTAPAAAPVAALPVAPPAAPAVVPPAAPLEEARADVPAEQPLQPPQPTAPVAPPAPAAKPTIDANELGRRLARLDPQRAMRTAVGAILATWHAEGLRPDQKVAPEQLEPIAWEHSLEDLRLTGNLSMLRLLDLPAMLVLRLPDASEPRFVALTRISDDQVSLVIDGEAVSVDTALLDRLWTGEAHVYWRDFETLGRTFGNEARGAHVARLQKLLARVGAYRGEPTGVFDSLTEEAVAGFQRSRLLAPDCRIGRLTRIVLYASVPGYRRPTLAGGGVTS
jgi:general secretion pathway protein A